MPCFEQSSGKILPSTVVCPAYQYSPFLRAPLLQMCCRLRGGIALGVLAGSRARPPRRELDASPRGDNFA